MRNATCLRCSFIRLLQLSWLVVLALCVSCAGENSSNTQDSPIVRQRIDAVNTNRGLTGRSVLFLPAGPCVMLHYPPIEPLQLDLEQLFPVEATAHCNVVASDELGEYWQAAIAVRAGNETMFNCATFALGEVLDLKADDWVSPVPTAETRYSVPAQVILDSYFDLVASYAGDELEQLPDVVAGCQAGDIVCFSLSSDDQIAHAHMGKLVDWHGRLLLVSKLGEGPIVRTTVAACARAYAGQFTQIQVYRRKP